MIKLQLIYPYLISRNDQASFYKQLQPVTIRELISSPLPYGWQQGLTDCNDVYFIDHLNEITSWFDPRVRKYSILSCLFFSLLFAYSQRLIHEQHEPCIIVLLLL